MVVYLEQLVRDPPIDLCTSCRSKPQMVLVRIVVVSTWIPPTSRQMLE